MEEFIGVFMVPDRKVVVVVVIVVLAVVDVVVVVKTLVNLLLELWLEQNYVYDLNDPQRSLGKGSKIKK